MDKDIFMPLFILGIPLLGIYALMQLSMNYKLRRQMIEKGYVDEAQQAIFKQQKNLAGYFSSLKWGLIVFFGGLGLVILEYIDYRNESPFPFGFVGMFIAFGFLIYYLVAKNEANKDLGS